MMKVGKLSSKIHGMVVIRWRKGKLWSWTSVTAMWCIKLIPDLQINLEMLKWNSFRLKKWHHWVDRGQRMLGQDLLCGQVRFTHHLHQIQNTHPIWSVYPPAGVTHKCKPWNDVLLQIMIKQKSLTTYANHSNTIVTKSYIHQFNFPFRGDFFVLIFVFLNIKQEV